MRGKCNVVVWYFENWKKLLNLKYPNQFKLFALLFSPGHPSAQPRIQLYQCVCVCVREWGMYGGPTIPPCTGHTNTNALRQRTVDRGRGLLKLNGSARPVAWWEMNPYFVSIKIIMYEIKTIFMDFLHFWFHINTRHLALVKHSIVLYQNSKKENVQSF